MRKEKLIVKVASVLLPLGIAESEVSILQSIDKVTAEEFYNVTRKDTENISFDKLPCKARLLYVAKVNEYLKARRIVDILLAESEEALTYGG